MSSRRVLWSVVLIAWGAAAPAATPAQSVPGVDAPDNVTALLLESMRGLEVREQRVEAGGSTPLTLRLVATPAAGARATRLIEATTSALQRLVASLGPFPRAELTLVDARWGDKLVGASYPGLIVVATRLLEPRGDRGLERAVIAALARQYWQVAPAGDPARRWLAEGLALYTGVRTIHDELEGRNFATERFFGGFAAHTSHAMLWSPSTADPRPKVRHFAEVEQPADAAWRAWTAAPSGEAQRVALALHTLERYLGPPAMQQAIEALQSRWQASSAGPDDLVAIVSGQRGADLRWFFDEALRFDARFDYGIASFSSEPHAEAAGEFETRVSLRRFGDGVFAGTAEPRTSLQAARSLKVVTRFEDGTSAEEWWDGRDVTMELVYSGPARAVSSSVDPEAMLLLDVDRANNTRVSAGQWNTTGARLTAFWLLWLQDVMLASSALL